MGSLVTAGRARGKPLRQREIRKGQGVTSKTEVGGPGSSAANGNNKMIPNTAGEGSWRTDGIVGRVRRDEAMSAVVSLMPVIQSVGKESSKRKS
jgi:hypothetical protein